MKPQTKTELEIARTKLLAPLGAVFLFSLLISFGPLLPAIYMVQMFDRVLSSRSEPTLYALTALVLFLMAVVSVLMFARTRLLARLANQVDDVLGPRVFDLVFRIGLEQPAKTSLQPIDDLTQLRQFIAGSALPALMDAPFIPIFFLVLYVIHPLVFATVAGFAVAIAVLAIINSTQTKSAIKEAQQHGRESKDFLTHSLRNADAVQAMGMLESLRLRWLETHLNETAQTTRRSDAGSLYGTAANLVRSSARIGVIAVAAYLVLQLEVSPGVMIATMIVTSRALGPLEALITGWPQLMEVRLAYRRLHELLEQFPARDRHLKLPVPEGEIRVEGIFASPGGQRGANAAPVLKGVSFTVQPGDTLAILGPSGSGKTTLARVILGLWPPLSGRVRFDGADVRHWDPLQFGRYVGYLPQDVQLFSGSIADNIARFGHMRSAKVVKAAKLARIHDLVLNLPKGYLTEVGPGGMMLSAGQRQRIGLARAIYDDPQFVVMDEPNSNLDDEGHNALMDAVSSLKEQGSTVIFISHRRSILATADQVLVLTNGQVRFLGTRDDFFATYTNNPIDPRPSTDGIAPLPEPQTKLPPPQTKTRSPSPPRVEPIDAGLDLGSRLDRWRALNAF